MKQLVCEMCGANDLIKDGGVFVCQYCGCKYTVEEAKKMMIEGTVHVQVDNTQNIEKYLQNARRAREKEDWEETEKYYNLVEQYSPKNIEAIFYSAYGKAKSSLVEEDIYKRQQIFKILSNCISVIDDNYEIENAVENEKIIKEISTDLKSMTLSNFVYTEWKNKYGVVLRTNKEETYKLFIQLHANFYDSLSHIIKIDAHEYLYKLRVEHAQMCLEIIRIAEFTRGTDNFYRAKDKAQNELDEYNTNIKPKKIEEYWKTHEDERLKLEKEKVDVEVYIKELEKSKEDIPGYKEKKSLESQIDKIQKEIEELGFFRGKEKKEKKQTVEKLNGELAKYNLSVNPVEDAINKNILSAKDKLTKIELEFTRDR